MDIYADEAPQHDLGDQPTQRSPRRLVAVGGAAALVLAGVGAGSYELAGRGASAADATHVLNGSAWGFGPDASQGAGSQPGYAATGGTGSASSAQQVGVVDIDTVLGYQGARAAGTGMVLTSDGLVLTNHHVVAGETSMTVTVVATGQTYDADVVGTDAADDVAVVQMHGASGLDTIRTNTDGASVGDEVTGVGNAGGVGGTPSAAPGRVTAVGQTITATDEDGSNPETVSGLIETDAAIAAGDSGGPLFNSDDEAVGMDTAGASDGSPQGYAIPIGTALSIAQQIESGSTGGNIQSGHAGFLGVSVQDVPGGGAQVAQVVDGAPAASAGIVAGDVITSVDGNQVGSTSDLSAAMSSLSAGQQVTVTWVDGDGQPQQGTVTLGSGPTR
jgi:S1-C subfamily serine protease